MTQNSRPQPGHINTWPTSDVGPYSSDQWANIFRNFFVGDNQVAEGPFVGFLNELEVTEAPANQLNVDTGGGIVNGHWFNNSQMVSFVPAAPAANPRIDVVVMVQNNSNVQRSAGIATPNNLIFPTVLTDYAGSASIEPFTCRLAILPGNEAGAPVAPTLDTVTATLFMVPLAQYDISIGGVVTNLTDLRDWCKFATFHPLLLDRQGGSASVWGTAGTTDYKTRLTGQMHIQMGVKAATIPNTSAFVTGTITFPQAFAAKPIVLWSIGNASQGDIVSISSSAPGTITAIDADYFVVRTTAAGDNNLEINWMAIGPLA